MDDPKQLWLFGPPQNDKPMERNLHSLSKEDYKELGNMFAELLINFLNKKKEAPNADTNL